MRNIFYYNSGTVTSNAHRALLRNKLSKSVKSVLIHISEGYSPIEKLFGSDDAGW